MNIPLLYIDGYYYIAKMLQTEYCNVFIIDNDYLMNGFEEREDAFKYIYHIISAKERNEEILNGF